MLESCLILFSLDYPCLRLKHNGEWQYSSGEPGGEDRIEIQ